MIRRPHKVDILFIVPGRALMPFDYMIPLGVASLAAVCEREGYSVGVADLGLYHGSLTRDLPIWDPGLIAIGGTTPTRHGSFAIARTAKQFFPDRVTVYGGVHATFAAEDTLRHVPEIDYVLQGEAEYPFLDVCDRILRGNTAPFSTIDGIAYRENGDILVTPKAARIDDLNALPLPARHLFPAYTLKLDFNDEPADFIMTSRGCPVSCTFCSASRMFPGGVRFRSMDSVCEELDTITSRRHIRGLKVFDSTFTADRDHVLAFCEAIAPYGLAWECEVRADTVDKEMLVAMKKAGCYYIDIGLETSNQELLRHLAKHITVDQAKQVLAWSREVGLRTKLFMIFGLYRQTFGDCLTDLRFLREHRHLTDLFANTMGLKIFPGTAIEKQLRSDGVIASDFSWALFHAPKKNWLLFESGDYYILEQPGLRFYHLLLTSVLLYLQMTNLSAEWLLRFIRRGVRAIGLWVLRTVRRQRSVL